MLRSQPIKAERTNPGEYYSIMSRHTLRDGRTPDPEIDCDPSRHFKLFAPPDRLVGDWYTGRLGDHNRQNFEKNFRPRYLDHLASRELLVRNLGERAMTHDITVMCIEPTPRFGESLLCHRRLFVEYSKLLLPEIKIEVK